MSDQTGNKPKIYFTNEIGHALDVRLNGTFDFHLTNGSNHEFAEAGEYEIPGLKIVWPGTERTALTFTQLGIDKFDGKVLKIHNGTGDILEIVQQDALLPYKLQPGEEFSLTLKDTLAVGNSKATSQSFSLDWNAELDARFVVVPPPSEPTAC